MAACNDHVRVWGRRMRAARIKMGWSLDQLGEEWGVHADDLQGFECGAVEVPRWLYPRIIELEGEAYQHPADEVSRAIAALPPDLHSPVERLMAQVRARDKMELPPLPPARQVETVCGCKPELVRRHPQAKEGAPCPWCGFELPAMDATGQLTREALRRPRAGGPRCGMCDGAGAWGELCCPDCDGRGWLHPRAIWTLFPG